MGIRGLRVVEALRGVRGGGNLGSEGVAEALMVIFHKPFYGEKSAYRLLFSNYLRGWIAMWRGGTAAAPAATTVSAP